MLSFVSWDHDRVLCEIHVRATGSARKIRKAREFLGVTQFEINRIRAKMRQLELSESRIDLFIRHCDENLETYDSACRTIDQWKKENPGEMILQALVCGAIAATLGGWIALMSGLK